MKYIISEFNFYCDEKTSFYLNESRDSKILLLGGCTGSYNFGDILQLKSVIKWYKENTSLDPIIVFNIHLIDDQTFLKRMKKCFGIENILFFSFQKIHQEYLEKLEIFSLEKTKSVECLHLYGGGLLNKRWGEIFLEIIEIIHQVFEISLYIVSGQQIERDFYPKLSRHFQKHPPHLIGCRDLISMQILNQRGLHACYSFDDAYESLLALTYLNRGNYNDDPSFLFHFNSSEYTSFEDHKNSLEQIAKNIEKTEIFQYKKIFVFQAFHYSNQRYINDSLSVLNSLEYKFKYPYYSIIDLSQIALNLWSMTDICLEYDLPLNSLAISSSYHISVFCALLDIPCFLQNFNSYYDHKKLGLGLKINDFDLFLRQPEKIHTEHWKTTREDWHSRLLSVHEKHKSQYNHVKDQYRISWNENSLITNLVSDRENTYEFQLKISQTLLQQELDKSANLWEQVQKLEAELRNSDFKHQETETLLQQELDKSANLWEQVQKSSNRIDAMESSKFWKLRNWWFSLKHIFGLR